MNKYLGLLIILLFDVMKWLTVLLFMGSCTLFHHIIVVWVWLSIFYSVFWFILDKCAPNDVGYRALILHPFLSIQLVLSSDENGAVGRMSEVTRASGPKRYLIWLIITGGVLVEVTSTGHRAITGLLCCAGGAALEPLLVFQGCTIGSKCEVLGFGLTARPIALIHEKVLWLLWLVLMAVI